MHNQQNVTSTFESKSDTWILMTQDAHNQFISLEEPTLVLGTPKDNILKIHNLFTPYSVQIIHARNPQSSFNCKQVMMKLIYVNCAQV